MWKLFSDIPSAIENSYEIARRCNIQLPLGDINMPIFPLEDNVDENEYFKSLVMQRLEKKILEKNINNKEPYINRIKTELDVILKMGYSGYFLIVSDFIEALLFSGTIIPLTSVANAFRNIAPKFLTSVIPSNKR